MRKSTEMMIKRKKRFLSIMEFGKTYDRALLCEIFSDLTKHQIFKTMDKLVESGDIKKVNSSSWDMRRIEFKRIENHE